jgi:beta-catenin-like protein 1
MVQKTSFLSFLYQQVSQKGFDSNRQYATELLAILLQESRPNRLKVCESMDVLLQALAQYRKVDPLNGDEVELVENLFDALMSCLVESEGKEAFMEQEGIQLMLLMLKQKMYCRMGALKVIATCLLNFDKGCALFVEHLGLKSLFPIFMKRGLKQYRKTYKEYSESQENGIVE